MSEFDASRAAARAVGKTVEESSDAGDDAGAEPNPDGADPEAGGDDDDGGTSSSTSTSRGTIREMVMSTTPDPPLSEVEDPWDPETGGTARIYRGIQKALGVDGLPAVADVFLGVLEASDDSGTSSTTSSSEAAGDQEDDEAAQIEEQLLEEVEGT